MNSVTLIFALCVMTDGQPDCTEHRRSGLTLEGCENRALLMEAILEPVAKERGGETKWICEGERR